MSFVGFITNYKQATALANEVEVLDSLLGYDLGNICAKAEQ
jgi:hypothetical protein